MPVARVNTETRPIAKAMSRMTSRAPRTATPSSENCRTSALLHELARIHCLWQGYMAKWPGYLAKYIVRHLHKVNELLSVLVQPTLIRHLKRSFLEHLQVER